MLSGSAYPYRVNIDAMIDWLGGRAGEVIEVIERVLREYGGTVPDQQLIEKAGLELAAWRTRPLFTLPMDSQSAIFWCEHAHALIKDMRLRRNGGSDDHRWCFHIHYAIRRAEGYARFLPESSPERIWLDLAREHAQPCCCLAQRFDVSPERLTHPLRPTPA